MISSAERSVSRSTSRKRLGDLRLGNADQAQGVAPKRGRTREHGADGLRIERRRPHRLELARRPRQDDHRGALGGDHEPGRGPGRVDRGRAARHHRLLSVGLAKRLGVEAQPPGELGEDSRDLLLHPLVEDQLAAREPGDHLRRQIVGRRAEPAAGDDQVGALGGKEPQRRLEVAGAVSDAEDVGDLHAQLAEPLRDPRTVSVAHPAGQDLGAGDDDPGPNRVGAHGHSLKGSPGP